MALRFLTLLAAAAVPLALAAGCNGAASQGTALPPAVPLALSGPGAGIPSAPAPAAVSLSETGSTLLYPLFGAWASAYHQRYPSVTITTAATGSGTGIADASDGTAAIGASDAFLSSGNLVQNPDLLNIPLAISAQQINYNLPGLRRGVHVRLNGAVLAQMYQGTIRTWNAPAIAALNPGVQLPATRVVPLHRAESSGDTFLFTSYLSTDDPAWNAAIGYGTTVAWPAAPAALPEQGNSGMVSGCASTPGCVAYVGISYLSQALGEGLGEAELENASGHFLLPNGASLRAAVASFVPATPSNEAISMVNGPAADGYPIVNYEYAIVSARQPSAVRARDVKAFLHWAITSGNAAPFLGQVRFQPLPAPVVSLADAQIARIS
ncbi:MAG TPA: phosphate ABC transporter substrate-binding protein PstS [Streptosporangiaceae bacterium]|nr:phosphate ABC transporter substrate-binding protein PstS [Streptosporangiaceae bacterium]